MSFAVPQEFGEMRSLHPPMDAEGTHLQTTDPVPQPSPAELDELFHHDSYQMLRWGGLRYAEFVVLQQIEPYDVAPEKRTWTWHQFVAVDEGRWFRFLRRDRWLSYDWEFPDTGGLRLDIDDDRVWGALRRVIEVACRIVDAALGHEWLSSYLDRSARESRHGVSYSRTYQTAPTPNSTIHRVVPVPADKRIDRQQAAAVLEELLTNLRWGFHAVTRLDTSPPLGFYHGHVVGATGVLWGTISMRANDLLPLFHRKTPEDAEGRQATIKIAMTMAHEIMFYDEERWGEAGQSFEAAVFGGSLGNRWPLGHPRILLTMIKAPPIAYRLDSFFQTYDGWRFPDPYRSTTATIPAAAVVSLVTAPVWDALVPRVGVEALRLRGVAFCEQVFSDRYGTLVARPRVLAPEDNPDWHEPWGDDMRAPTLRRAAELLRLRRRELRRARPWYAGQFAVWSLTPYGLVGLRGEFSKFVRHFGWRNYDAEEGARQIVRRFRSSWAEDGAAQSDGLQVPQTRIDSKRFFLAVSFAVLAALPFRRTEKQYTPNLPNPSPMSLKPSLRAGSRFAGPKVVLDMMNNHWLKGALEKDKKSREPRKLMMPPNLPFQTRNGACVVAMIHLNKWRSEAAAVRVLGDEFYRQVLAIKRQYDQSPVEDQWLDFDLQLPPWPGAITDPRGTYKQQVEAAVASDGGDADAPAWVTAMGAVAGEPVRDASPVRYFSPAEIGEHQRLDSVVKWALHEDVDTKELDVYDISKCVPAAWDAAARDLATVLDPSFETIGRLIRVEPFRGVVPEPEKIGRAMRLRHPEDLRVNNEKNGRPRWVVFGNHVYDLNDVRLGPEMSEMETIIRTSAGENPMLDVLDAGYDSDLVAEHMRPYNIGWTEEPFSGDALDFRLQNRPFTVDEVKWHAFRQTGMYIIIGDGVYDFTEYCDMHPGGGAIIERLAGGDATQEYNRAHENGALSPHGIDVDEALRKLRIGRLVPSQPENQPPLADEIKLRQNIYSRRGFQTIDLWGTDGTKAMELEGGEHSKTPYTDLWLKNFTFAITAKAVRAPEDAPLMGLEVLWRMTGAETATEYWGSYVCDGEFVYNMTTFIRHSKDSGIVDAIKRHAGTVLSGASPEVTGLRSWLVGHCRYRIIARLYQNSHGRDAAMPAWSGEPFLKICKVSIEDAVKPEEEKEKKKTWAEV
ncbi:cytochrome b5-like heme steroid binding domain-containing protein, partial [Colletotrichum musicola]